MSDKFTEIEYRITRNSLPYKNKLKMKINSIILPVGVVDKKLEITMLSTQ